MELNVPTGPEIAQIDISLIAWLNLSKFLKNSKPQFDISKIKLKINSLELDDESHYENQFIKGKDRHASIQNKVWNEDLPIKIQDYLQYTLLPNLEKLKKSHRDANHDTINICIDKINSIIFTKIRYDCNCFAIFF